MIFYPLSTLMSAGIQEILVITSPWDQALFQKLLGDGSDFGVQLSYQVQEKASGIAEALIIGEDFLEGNSCGLILGDNLFFGAQLSVQLKAASHLQSGAVVFVHEVANSSQYGVAEFDQAGNVTNLCEKPSEPKSNFAVTGLYFYDGLASQMAKALTPSTRGELEITDLNNAYLKRQQLKVEVLGRGTAWLDTGNPADMLEAGSFVKAIESRQGIMVGCPEEVGFIEGWITEEQLKNRASKLGSTQYGKYLNRLASK